MTDIAGYSAIKMSSLLLPFIIVIITLSSVYGQFNWNQDSRRESYPQTFRNSAHRTLSGGHTDHTILNHQMPWYGYQFLPLQQKYSNHTKYYKIKKANQKPRYIDEDYLKQLVYVHRKQSKDKEEMLMPLIFQNDCMDMMSSKMPYKMSRGKMLASCHQYGK